MNKNQILVAPRFWQNSRRFMPLGFRAAPVKQKTGHWYGGAPTHRGAKCFTCKKKLRLVWDINLRDKGLPEWLVQSFPKLKRLPLYYCFNCPTATTYQLKTDTAILSLDPAGHDGGDETPYACDSGVPDELPRTPLQLTRIPTAIDALIDLEGEIGLDLFDEAARKMLSRYLGMQQTSTWDVPFSQFGGLPAMVQGHQDIQCPNPKCPSPKHQFDRGFHMKELAVVEKEFALGFEWVYAPLAYHICWVCGTIQGNFRCS